MSHVYFIGTGLGIKDLITVKGKYVVEKVDIIIYVGLLVLQAVIDCRKEESELYNNTSMDLGESIIKCNEACIHAHNIIASKGIFSFEKIKN